MPVLEVHADKRRSLELSPIVLPRKIQNNVERTVAKRHNPSSEGTKADLVISLRRPKTELPSSGAKAKTPLQENLTQPSRRKSLIEMVKSHRFSVFEANDASKYDSTDKSGTLNPEEMDARLEQKIEILTNDIMAKYARKKIEMDKQGVFHPDANLARTQSMCANELQRSLKIKELREEVIQDMLTATTPFVRSLKKKGEHGDAGKELEEKLHEQLRRKSQQRKKSTVVNRSRRSSIGSRLSILQISRRQCNGPDIAESKYLLPDIQEADQPGPLASTSINNNPIESDFDEATLHSRHPHVFSAILLLKQGLSPSKRSSPSSSEVILSTEDRHAAQARKAWEQRSNISIEVATDSSLQLEQRLQHYFMQTTVDFVEIRKSSKKGLKRNSVRNPEDENDEDDIMEADTEDMEKYKSLADRRKTLQARYKQRQSLISQRLDKKKVEKAVPLQSPPSTPAPGTPLLGTDVPRALAATSLDSKSGEERRGSTPLLGRRNSHHKKTDVQVIPQAGRKSVYVFKPKLATSYFPLCAPKEDEGSSAPHDLHTLLRAKDRRLKLQLCADKIRWVWNTGDEDAEATAEEEDGAALTEPENIGNPNEAGAEGGDEVEKKMTPLMREEAQSERSSELNNILFQVSTDLHERLHNVFERLEMSYVDKLKFLEKYTLIEDPNTFFDVLLRWEKASHIVAIREKIACTARLFDEGCFFLPEAYQIDDSDRDFLRSIEFEIPEAPVLTPADPAPFKSWIHRQLSQLSTKCQTILTDFERLTGDEMRYQGQAYVI